ncbi:MAG: transglutaminase domain-containing protein [Candidatus Eisenbacteria bacterium]|nr:transglutaminase domain-containing protein [Candidatus Eisenbacteria bacterium]
MKARAGRVARPVTAAALCALSLAACGAARADRRFEPEAAADVLALVGEADRDALAASLADAGANWTELATAIRTLQGEERDDCVWLVVGMPRLDRVEMTAENLIEHVRCAHRARREMPYPVPADMFRPYILAHRMEDEPLAPWRKRLFDLWGPAAREEGSAAAAARRVNRFLADSVEVHEPDFFGPRKSPSVTLTARSGSEVDVAILACAAMKALGIPSRRVSVAALGEEPGGRSWIEIFDGEGWLPLYPLEPDAFGEFGHVEAAHRGNVTVAATLSGFELLLVTERYTETATVEMTFADGGGPAAGFDGFSVCALNAGALVALDALETAADDDGRFTATVGEGTYVALAGLRDESGNPFVMMEPFEAAPGETVFVSFDVSPRGAAAPATPDELSSLAGSLEALVEFDPREEPSARMLPLIERALARRAPVVTARYAQVARAVEGAGADARLPRVRVYAAAGGEVILERQGYDLNIGHSLLAAVDAWIARALRRPDDAARPEQR